MHLYRLGELLLSVFLLTRVYCMYIVTIISNMRFLSLFLVATLAALPSDSWDSLDTHCSNTRFGCCSDGITATVDLAMSNCPKIRLIGGCEGTQFGCCKDGSFAKDLQKSNCKNAPLKSYESILIGEQAIGSNSSHRYSQEQTDSLILISLGAGLFTIVLLSIVLLLISAVVIIVCRIVKQKRARKLRIILECDDESGVEMGSPLMAEEFGVNLSI